MNTTNAFCKAMIAMSKSLHYTLAFCTGLSTRIKTINEKNKLRKRAE